MSSAAMAGEEKSAGGHLWPGPNQLQLSVGCSDDEDSVEDGWANGDQLRARYTEFLQARASGCNSARNDFDEEAMDVGNADRVGEAAGPFDANLEELLERDDSPSPMDVLGADFSLAAAHRNLLAGALDGQGLFQTLSNNVYRSKPPKILNGYLFGTALGEGSYARVKEVLEEGTLVRRAIKIIKLQRLRKIPNGAENVERELSILSSVRHPNVIRMLESFRVPEKQKLYMVLEYCVTNLQLLVDCAPQKHLGEYQAQTYMKQLVSGLEYLHSQGIVHKDIKPGNLLIALDSTLKISDFGTAERLARFAPDDRLQLSQGTPKFQAPEIVSGNAPDFRGFPVDVWASGITLYNLLSGQYPFNGEVIMRLFTNIATQALEMPTNIGKDAEALLRGLLDKDPEKRWTLSKVKSSDWLERSIPQEERTWIHAGAATRPLTVMGALDQLYGHGPDEDKMSQSLESQTAMLDHAEAEPPQKVIVPPPPPRRNRSFLTMCLRSPSSP